MPTWTRVDPISLRFKDKSSSSTGFWVMLPQNQASSSTSEDDIGPVRWCPVDLAIDVPLALLEGAAEDLNEDEFAELAHWRPIDLSIQFMLWWTPFLILLGWWTGRPMHLLFGASCHVVSDFCQLTYRPLTLSPFLSAILDRLLRGGAPRRGLLPC